MTGGRMRLHSSRPHTEDVDNVLNGTKPTALVDVYAARYAERLGLSATPVPKGTFRHLASRLAYVVYRPEEPETARRVLEILAKHPIGLRGEAWHRELGRALGYSEEDISYFLQRFEVKR